MRHLSLAATLLLLGALGCGDRDDREVGGVTDTALAPAAAPAEAEPPEARDFGFEERQDFVQSIEQQLAQLDQEIEQLAAQAKSRGGAVSDRALANIRAARRTVNRNLERVNQATAANWEETKLSVNQSVESLSEAVEIAQPK